MIVAFPDEWYEYDSSYYYFVFSISKAGQELSSRCEQVSQPFFFVVGFVVFSSVCSSWMLWCHQSLDFN